MDKVTHITHVIENEKLNEKEISKQISSEISKFTSKTILVTVVNDGYVNIAKNWLCNTVHMDIHNKVFIITTNERIKLELSSLYSHLKIICISVKGELSKHLRYSHAGYLRMMILRTKILNLILLADFEVFLFECDFLWLKNPLQFLISKRGKHDIIVIPDTKDGNVINGGFFFLFPTHKTKMLFAKLTSMMDTLGNTISKLDADTAVPESKNDQVFLTSLLKRRYGGINYFMASFENFSSGQWYNTPKLKKISWKPFVIHNNYIIGNIKKEKRAKKWNHWFLNDEYHCNDSLLTHFLHNF